MQLVFTRMPGESTSSGGVYAHCIKILLACKVREHALVEYMPCIYSHAR